MSQPPELPPDPMTATKNAMASRAQEMAQDSAQRWFNRTIGPYLPASILARMQKNAKKTFWGAVSGCLFSLFFFAAVAVVLVFVAGIVGYALLTG